MRRMSSKWEAIDSCHVPPVWPNDSDLLLTFFLIDNSRHFCVTVQLLFLQYRDLTVTGPLLWTSKGAAVNICNWIHWANAIT